MHGRSRPAAACDESTSTTQRCLIDLIAPLPTMPQIALAAARGESRACECDRAENQSIGISERPVFHETRWAARLFAI